MRCDSPDCIGHSACLRRQPGPKTRTHTKEQATVLPALQVRASGALFTTEKKQPDKAERNAVFEDYRIPKNQRKDYVAEYRVPVSLGGSNTYSNIEALLKSQAKIKRRVQKELEAKLRRKEISLDEAQLRILNWQTDPISASVR